MSEEIKELDMDKYLVLKWDDIGKYLSLPQKEELHEIIKSITIERARFGHKPQNQYLVLNLEDEIDTDALYDYMVESKECFNGNGITKVKNLALHLVNAILKAKGD